MRSGLRYRCVERRVVVRGYRAQHLVERAFRQIKDSGCIAIRPELHWTDHQIEMHVLVRVLVLVFLVRCLPQPVLDRKAVPGSILNLLKDLAAIREVDVVVYSAGGEPELRSTLSEMSPEQRKM